MSKPLRICVLVNEFPSPSETFVLNQVVGLQSAGCDVTVLATGPDIRQRNYSTAGNGGFAGRVRYLDLPKNWFKRSAAALPMTYKLMRHRPELVPDVFNILRHGRQAMSLRLLYWADRLVHEEPFDVILAHFGQFGQLGVKLRQLDLISGRLATVFHGVDMSVHIRANPKQYKELFVSGDLFLPISDHWRERLIEMGADPVRTHVHHMGVEIEPQRYRRRERDKSQPLSLLSVGRLVEKKGIDDALYAFAELLRYQPSARYTIIGDGPLRAELEELAERLEIVDAVEFIGWVENEQVIRLMQQSDILLAPSVTALNGDQEGIPVTIMEAMACGMLVVSTEHSGIPELIENGKNGLLVPEGDVMALGESLIYLCDNPGVWPDLSEAGYRKVTREFELGVLNARLLERLQALARGREGSSQMPSNDRFGYADDVPVARAAGEN